MTSPSPLRHLLVLVSLLCAAGLTATATGSAANAKVVTSAASSATTYQGFDCGPPAGVDLPDTYNSFATVDGSHVTIWCTWDYAPGTLPDAPFDMQGFYCHGGPVPLPRSRAHFGVTHGTMTCTNL